MERVKRSKVTVNQYAQWRFESDKALGLFSVAATFENLPIEEQGIILDEAHEYVHGSRQNDWPLDMMDRIEEDETNGATSEPIPDGPEEIG